MALISSNSPVTWGEVCTAMGDIIRNHWFAEGPNFYDGNVIYYHPKSLKLLESIDYFGTSEYFSGREES